MGHLWRWPWRRPWRLPEYVRLYAYRLQRAVEYVGRSQSAAEGFGSLLVSGEQRGSRKIESAHIAHSHFVFRAMRNDDSRRRKDAGVAKDHRRLSVTRCSAYHVRRISNSEDREHRWQTQSRRGR